jgi:hypothetical protein
LDLSGDSKTKTKRKMTITNFSDAIQNSENGDLNDASLRFKIKSAIVLEMQRKKRERMERMEEERRRKEQAQKDLLKLLEENKKQEEAEKKAKKEAEKRAKEEAEKKAKEEAERKAKEEAEKLALEEAEKRAREEAEKKVKEEEALVLKIKKNKKIIKLEDLKGLDEIDAPKDDELNLNKPKEEVKDLPENKENEETLKPNTKEKPETVQDPEIEQAPNLTIDEQQLDNNIDEIKTEMSTAISTDIPTPLPVSFDSIWELEPNSYRDPLLSDEDTTFCLKSLSISYAMEKINKKKDVKNFDIKYESLFDDSISVSAQNDCLLNQFIKVLKIKKDDLENSTVIVNNKIKMDDSEKIEKTDDKNDDIQDYVFVFYLQDDQSILSMVEDSNVKHLQKVSLKESHMELTDNNILNYVNMKTEKLGFWKISQNLDGSYKISNFTGEYDLNVFHVDPGTQIFF